jgi:hypothetical protein
MDCNKATKKSQLINAVNSWLEDKDTLSNFKNPHSAMFKMWESEFYVPMKWAILDEGEQLLTPGKIRKFTESLFKLNQRMKDGDIASNDFAKIFWTGSTFGKRDPAIGSMLSRLQDVSGSDKVRTMKSAEEFKDITDMIKVISGADGIISKALLNKSIQKLRNLDLDLVKAIDSQNNPSISKARKAISDFVEKNKKLKAFDDFIGLIETGMPKIMLKYREMIESDEFALPLGVKNKEKYFEKIDNGESLLKIKEIKFLKSAMSELGMDTRYSEPLMKYNDMMDSQYLNLKNGINAVINSKIKRLQFSRGIESEGVKSLQNLRDKLTKELMPRFEQGFFPHYVRDLNATFMEGLMPKLQKLDSSGEDLLLRKSSTLESDVKEITDWVTNHAKARRQKETPEYSRNFFDVVKGYVDDINHFNTSAFLEETLMDARLDVLKMYKEGKSGPTKYMTNVSDFITDMHKASNGNTKMSESAHLAMKTLLAFEFTSKLGWNVRGAARNATQRALDYVRFGYTKSVAAANYFDTIRDEGGVRGAEKILEEAGFLFEEITPELLESGIQEKPSMFKSRYMDEDGNIQYRKEHFGHKISEGMSWVSKKSSFLHRKAENWNRKNTFKVAYGSIHKILMESAEFSQQMSKKKKSLESRANEISTAYAKNMVLVNHFDYADYAKSKLMRGDIKSLGKYGNLTRFMFQFQHYGMEFLERNTSIFKEASADVRSGADFAEMQGVHQAMRMGIAYGLAPLLAYVVLGLKADNLVEHDTAKRITQWANLFSNDPEKINEAFYGKGPIVSTFGGPLLGDMIDLGISIGMINEKEPEAWYEYLYAVQGYKYDDDLVHTGSRTKIFNTLISTNSFGKRALNRHIPMIFENKRNPLKNIADVGFNELSMYPTSKINLPFDMYKGEPLFNIAGEKWLDVTGTRRKKENKRHVNYRMLKHMRDLEKSGKKS